MGLRGQFQELLSAVYSLPSAEGKYKTVQKIGHYGYITSFSDGYSHAVTTAGTNLSGGQRQRLLIARALAGKPEILILDDSSSALDYKTDANLRTALSASLPDSTVITVAQRVSSVKNCDLILVINGGKIIGCGKHEDLMENCEEYKEISASQMGGAFLD